MFRSRSSRRRALRFGALGACFTTLLAVSGAGAQTSYPIDTCEILPFEILQSGTGSTTETLPVPPPAVGHVIGSVREVIGTVFQGEGILLAELVPSTGGNYIELQVPPDAQGALRYPLSPAGIDITAGGTVDRIEMDVVAAGAVNEIWCDLRDLDPVGFALQQPISSSVDYQVLTWELSSFHTIDVTDVTSITFRFPDPALYRVREIRLRGTTSRDLNYVLYQEATSVPPIPSPPVEFGMLDEVSDPLYDMDVSIGLAGAGFNPQMTWGWTAVPSFGGGAMHAALDWTDFAPFEELALAFDFDVEGGESGLFPQLFPPDPVHGPEGITLVFPVELRDAPAGNLVGTSWVWLTVDPGPQQAENAMEFVNVAVGQNRGSTGFRLAFLLVPGSAGVETIWPILEWRLWADVSEPVTTGVGGALPHTPDRPVLRALPSVTASGAEIRSSRPFGPDDRVRVHDVSGRLLRTLPAPPGARSLHWDGRGDGGRPLPAGVYFLRPGGSSLAPARVVKTR